MPGHAFSIIVKHPTTGLPFASIYTTNDAGCYGGGLGCVKFAYARHGEIGRPSSREPNYITWTEEEATQVSSIPGDPGHPGRITVEPEGSAWLRGIYTSDQLRVGFERLVRPALSPDATLYAQGPFHVNQLIFRVRVDQLFKKQNMQVMSDTVYRTVTSLNSIPEFQDMCRVVEFNGRPCAIDIHLQRDNIRALYLILWFIRPIFQAETPEYTTSNMMLTFANLTRINPGLGLYYMLWVQSTVNFHNTWRRVFNHRLAIADMNRVIPDAPTPGTTYYARYSECIHTFNYGLPTLTDIKKIVSTGLIPDTIGFRDCWELDRYTNDANAYPGGRFEMGPERTVRQHDLTSILRTSCGLLSMVPKKHITGLNPTLKANPRGDRFWWVHSPEVAERLLSEPRSPALELSVWNGMTHELNLITINMTGRPLSYFKTKVVSNVA